MIDCPHCEGRHRLFTALDACAQKHKKEECACPRYWRRRWASHSYPHGCPLFEKGSVRPQEAPGASAGSPESTDPPETGEDE